MKRLKVKIISDTIQEFNGEKYYLCGKYFQRNGVRLHRVVWEYHYGKIPKGLVIDHIDRNQNNNNISNLRLATYSINNRNVSNKIVEKRKKWMDEIRPLTKAWHASKEGKEWHKKMAKEAWNDRKPKEFECAHCHKKFYSKALHSRFCSNNCKQRARTRRLKGLPEDAML